MSKPGYFKWAESDAYAAIDIGSDNKLEPQATGQTDGFYRGYRPGPDTVNWLMNRLAHAQRGLARIQVMNHKLILTDTTDYQGGRLIASCHTSMGTGLRDIFLFYNDPVVGSIAEYHSADGGATWSTPTSSPVFAPGVAGGLVIDADGDGSTRRIVVADDGAIADLVRYATAIAGGSWTAVTFTAGAPTLAWRSVGCDRDTAAAGAAQWCIGDDAGGGSSVLWSSVDGINFAVDAAWPGATVTEPLHGIYHSCHPVGGFGPSDLGNPTWLVLSDTYATRSADGAAWTAAAHGLALGGGSFGHRSAAYSRAGNRWVVVLPAAAGGDVAYSDDNGATWTTLASALPNFPGAGFEPSICGDGYGTFLVTTAGDSGSDTRVYISTDNGGTWTTLRLPSANYAAGAGALDGVVCEAAVDEGADVDEISDAVTAFVIGLYDDSDPETEIFRSLLI